MKTLILAAIRCSLMFTAVAALSVACPASVQAVPTTYQYTGNPFTDVSGPYTTSDFVSGMVTLAGPLAPNFSGTVTPTAFTFSDGFQTINYGNANYHGFYFATDASGAIVGWYLSVATYQGETSQAAIYVDPTPGFGDHAYIIRGHLRGEASNTDDRGTWRVLSTPDAGSTLSLMTLTLMALGLVARRFQRAAA